MAGRPAHLHNASWNLIAAFVFHLWFSQHVGPFSGAEAAVSMNRLVSHMRKQRFGMVQTVQQYIFIYQALCDEIKEAFAEPG